jgi:hypothetical protein
MGLPVLGHLGVVVVIVAAEEGGSEDPVAIRRPPVDGSFIAYATMGRFDDERVGARKARVAVAGGGARNASEATGRRSRNAAQQ